MTTTLTRIYMDGNRHRTEHIDSESTLAIQVTFDDGRVLRVSADDDGVYVSGDTKISVTPMSGNAICVNAK